MSQAQPAQLELRADLRLEVDGSLITLRGEGSRLIATLEDARGLRSKTPQATLRTQRRTLRLLADRLSELGLSTVVRTTAGDLLEAGAGVRSTPVARLVSGSRHVRIGRPRALYALAFRRP